LTAWLEVFEPAFGLCARRRDPGSYQARQLADHGGRVSIECWELHPRRSADALP